jgi:hypothetical protein
VLVTLIALAALTLTAQAPLPDALDKVAAKWVDDTFKKMTLDDKVGQLVFTATNSTYLATDTDAYDAVAQKIRTLHLGGVHVFGGAEPAAALMLAANPAAPSSAIRWRHRR